MPFNGSGVFTRLYSWVNDAAANIKIRADRMDNEFNGIATALSTCITKDGQTTVTNDLPMSGFNHTSVGDATSRNQYASYGQLEDGKGLPTVGGTADAVTLAYSIPHTAYVNGMTISWVQSGANTGAATVNLDGIGVKSVTKNGSTALAAADLPANAIITARYDGTQFQIDPLQTIDLSSRVAKAGDTMTGALTMSSASIIMTTAAINEAKGADIASATTTDIGAATGNYINVTGTTTITGLGTIQAGTQRIVNFNGALTLTHNATSLILPTGASITTTAGDTATFVSLGSGNWVCTNYQRASGSGLTVTPWVAYTPATFQGLEPATGVSFFSRRVGGNLEIRGKFTAGTTTASEARISFGFNGTDANVTSSSTALASGVNIAGTFGISANVAAGLHTLIERSVSYLTFSSQTGSSNSLTKLNGNAFASGTQFSITASVPISGWS